MALVGARTLPLAWRQTREGEQPLQDREYTLPIGTTIGYRTALAVPMLHDGAAIGAIVVARDRVAPFSDKHVVLLQTFADQAVIAIENVRLFEAEKARTRELTESLQQQTATADVLKVISRSTFDLRAVLDTLVEFGSALVRGGHGPNPPPDRGRLLRRGEIRLLARIH